MKRVRLISIPAIISLYGIVLIAHSQYVYAAKTFSNADLKGEYYYNLVQIRQDETPDVDYCDEFGTITFDGAGLATGTGTRKCSVTGPATESGDFTYSVNPDGSVLITEVGFTDPKRGQLVDKGRMVLIDGTTRDALIYVTHGVAVKK